jgi:hypothetical protein
LNLAQLSSLIGAELRYVAGPQLWQFLNSDYIFAAFGDEKISFQGDIFSETFEGFEADYSKIAISVPSDSAIDKALKDGYAYYFHKGEQLMGISIVRDRVKYVGSQGETWEYVTDSGVIFELAKGIVAITKLGHHDETLQVTYLDRMVKDQIPNTVSHFDSDLFHQYQFSREFIPMENLL